MKKYDNNYNHAKLILKHLREETSADEKDALNVWLQDDPKHQELLSNLSDEKFIINELELYTGFDREEARKEIFASIYRKKRNILRNYISVAATLATIALGIYFFSPFRNLNHNTPGKYVSEDVAPGREGATLTLANGKRIRLTDAKNGILAREAGVAISKAADGQLIYNIKGNAKSAEMNTLSTNNGETYRVRLPDGSEVWLNAASSLKYYSSLLSKGNRFVVLTGEAYFQITKDKLHPFIVQTKTQKVEVLGTHFNINSYSNEPVVATTLLEGSVRVSSESTTEIITPGYQSKLNAKGDMTVVKVDTDPYVAWKNRQFSFENENIQTIMRMVERWYDVKVEYVGDLSNERFWGGVSRFDKVSKVLSVLESTGKVYFQVKGNTIYVHKNEQ